MPIYDYRCEVCGLEFEELVFTSLDVVGCRCGSSKVTRLMSLPAPARIQDVCINSDKGGRFRVDDATFHPSVSNPLPWDRGKDVKVYDMEFGKGEKSRLEKKAQLDNI